MGGKEPAETPRPPETGEKHGKIMELVHRKFSSHPYYMCAEVLPMNVFWVVNVNSPVMFTTVTSHHFMEGR